MSKEMAKEDRYAEMVNEGEAKVGEVSEKEVREIESEVEEVKEKVGAPQKTREGDFIFVNYTIKIKETGEVIDTTIEEIGKKFFEAGRVYEPRLVIVGKGFLMKAIEEELIGMEVDQEKIFDIPPEKAFGLRDPNKVKVIPIRRLKDVEGPITIGSKITVDGREGIVRNIESGRVQIDFNPYLAGKHLECSVKVVKIIEDKLEKIKALIHTRIPDVEVEKFTIEHDDAEIRIIIPREAFLLPALQMSKRILAKDIIDNMNIERVVFLESYDKQVFQ
ncbi:MAG: peptidylprolyl isomerase [Aigarchaeota archaeon]|nr:peptidylprolyl isomerase [Aigarchaeota archaeon]MCX8192199.1 peptidylprolyl isomerase [Nitrososphaeria archaeon]MDW7986195.1 FKBP-type peptidyl-prolyl cis-trans isomerase [Nitrososphaerota archaeon]